MRCPQWRSFDICLDILNASSSSSCFLRITIGSNNPKSPSFSAARRHPNTVKSKYRFSTYLWGTMLIPRQTGNRHQGRTDIQISRFQETLNQLNRISANQLYVVHQDRTCLEHYILKFSYHLITWFTQVFSNWASLPLGGGQQITRSQ